MNPTYNQIAELFAAPLTISNPETDEQRVKGRNAEESVLLGNACLNDGDYEGAIAHFKLAVEQKGEDDSSETLIDLARAYEYSDQSPQAYRQYLKALKSKHENPEPLVGISELQKRHGRFRDSIESLQTALKLEPESPYLLFKLAETLRSMGEPTRALAAVLAAVQVKPDDPFYHYWIGDLLIELGKYPEALEALRAAIELSPGDDYLYLRAAVAFWRSDRRTEAVKSIRLASDLDTEKHVYYGLLEAMLDEMGQTEEANQESARADQMDRWDHDILSRTLKEMGIDEE